MNLDATKTCAMRRATKAATPMARRASSLAARKPCGTSGTLSEAGVTRPGREDDARLADVPIEVMMPAALDVDNPSLPPKAGADPARIPHEAPAGEVEEEGAGVGPSVAEALRFEDPRLDESSLVLALAGLPPEARANRADLARASEVYEAAAAADNTLRAYRQRFRLFLAWCSSFGLSALPAHAEVVRLHVMQLAYEHHLSLSTIDVTLAAIARAHRLIGRDPPSSERLTLALRGLRQRLGPLPHKPIPLPVMRQIVSACDGGLAARDRALLLTAYFGRLRRCQVAGLCVEHAHRRPDGYFLHLVEPRKRAEPPVPVPFHVDPVLCPVLALDMWIATRGRWTAQHREWSAGKGPLFVALDVRGRGRQRVAQVGQALIPEDVDRILTLRARAAGVALPVSAHGLRAGTGEDRERSPRRTHNHQGGRKP